MPCCKENQVYNLEELKVSAEQLGFASEWIADVLERWGEKVLVLIVNAVRTGFSTELVVEVFEKLGPMFLEIFVKIFHVQQLRTQEGFEGQEAILDASILEVLLKKYLPMLMEKYGDKIVQFVIDWLLRVLSK